MNKTEKLIEELEQKEFTWEESYRQLSEHAVEMEKALGTAVARSQADDSDNLVASCNCLTKTPEPERHLKGCKYRLISERDEARLKLAEAERKLAGNSLSWLYGGPGGVPIRANTRRVRNAGGGPC